MKRIFFILITICFLTVAMGQVTKMSIPDLPKNNAIKISLLSPIAATLNLSHEYKLNSFWSLQNGLAITSLKLTETGQKSYGFEGFQYSLDIRKYRKNKIDWNGWYHQFFLRYAQYTYHNYRQDSITQNKVIQLKEDLHGINLGYAFGYQKVFQNKYIIDSYVGYYLSIPTFYSANLSEETILKYKLNSLKENPITSTAGLRIGLKVGYLF